MSAQQYFVEQHGETSIKGQLFPLKNGERRLWPPEAADGHCTLAASSKRSRLTYGLQSAALASRYDLRISSRGCYLRCRGRRSRKGGPRCVHAANKLTLTTKKAAASPEWKSFHSAADLDLPMNEKLRQLESLEAVYRGRQQLLLDPLTRKWS